MLQDIRKKALPRGGLISPGAFGQKAMIVGRHPVGMHLKMGMQQRAAGGRQMILGNAHVYRGRIGFMNTPQVGGTVKKTVFVNGRRSGADFHEMPIVEQADGGVGGIREEIGEQDRTSLRHAPGRVKRRWKTRGFCRQLRLTKGTCRYLAGMRGRRRQVARAVFRLAGAAEGNAAAPAGDRRCPDFDGPVRRDTIRCDNACRDARAAK